MKDQEMIEAETMASDLSSDVSLDQFIDHLLMLDKETFNKIYDDQKEREKFSKLSAQERLMYFHPDLQSEIQILYHNFHVHKQSAHALSISVYRIGALTNASYKEIAEKLEKAMQKQFSKSYISKLYRVGKILSVAPELVVVSDTEKLAELARIPEAKLSKMIESNNGIVRVANHDVATASRAQIQDIVRKEVATKPRALSVVQNVPGGIWDIESLRRSLTDSLLHIDQQNEAELMKAIENCIRIIDLRNK
jgi:hypothetical protein